MSEKVNAKERKRPSKGALVKRVILVFAIWAALGLAAKMAMQVWAAEPATSAFDQTWTRTDEPVALDLVDRTWMWGPDGFTTAMSEPYAESPGGQRTVQYFDKSRMEDNAFRAAAPWDVTNGLLVVELVTGKMQVGDNDFEQHAPALVNVAGDRDVSGVQYATLAGLLDAPALADGATIIHRVDTSGNVTSDSSLASFNVTAAEHVQVPGIDHQVASPFWAFMNSSGTVSEDGVHIDAPMFLSPFYATGYPITEAYWAEVKVAGTYQDVLLQCFERRCLTYTPGNVPGWQVEAGNVGQHYYAWRYGQVMDEPASTPEATPSPIVTATVPGDGTTPPTASPSPTEPADATGTPPASPTAQPTGESYRLVAEWGEGIVDGTEFELPQAIAASDDDFVYVAEWGADRIQKYTTEGVFVTMWSSNAPTDIAVDSDGHVYVTDGENDRIYKFSSSGQSLGQVQGANPFSEIDGIAVDRENNLYVADYDRIHQFDDNGVRLGGWPLAAADIAVDQDGIIYALDEANLRVQMIDSNGTKLGHWGDPSRFNLPISIAVSDNGIVYIVDTHCSMCFQQTGAVSRVLAFDSNGIFLGSWGESGSEPGQFGGVYGIAVDADGYVYLPDYGNNRLQKFDSQGQYLDSWGDGRRGRIAPNTTGLALDPDGNLYLADVTYYRVQVFESLGNFDFEFGEQGVATGQFVSTDEIAVSQDNHIFVVDSRGGRVLKFGRNGEFVAEFGNGILSVPFALAIDQEGNVYVCDIDTNTIQVFSSSGNRIDFWGGSGNGDGQFDYPTGVAVYGDRVYVVDHNNDRVQVFGRDGTYLEQWGEAGDGEGEFAEPLDIAVDADGFVFVVDTGNHRVQKFSPQGDFLTAFGAQGGSGGPSNIPVRIDITDGGEVYVLDVGTQQVQVFE